MTSAARVRKVLWESPKAELAIEEIDRQLYFVQRKAITEGSAASIHFGKPQDIALTQRQKEVIRGIARNLRNKEIATRLNIAERTVKHHITELLRKWGCESRLQLAMKLGDLAA